MKKSNRNLKLLSGLTIGHMTNDFYHALLPIFIPSIIVAFSLKYYMAGFLLFSMSITGVVFSPTIGYYADMKGIRKFVILAGFIIFGIMYPVMGMANNYYILIAVVIVLGIGTTTFHPQSIALISVYFKKRKGLAAGVHGIGGSLGTSLAPLAGGFLIAAYGWREGLGILAIPAIIVVILLYLIMKEPPRVVIEKGMFKGITMQIVLLGIVFSAVGVVQSGFVAFLPAYYVSLGYDIRFAGTAAFIMLIPGIFSQLIGGGLYDRFGGRWVFTLSLGFVTVFLLMFNQVHGILAFPILALIGFFTAATWPVGLIFASDLAVSRHIGTSVGMISSIFTLFAAVNPLWVGYLIDIKGFEFAFMIIAVVTFAGFCMTFFLPKKGSY